MNLSNLGYLYFKEYYNEYFDEYNKKLKNLKEESIKKQNEKLFKAIDIQSVMQTKKIGQTVLFFKTTYPGLLIGSGLIHSIGIKGESKLGFQFDYTTGLPIINGSSIKGVLRNIFDLVDTKKEAVEYLKSIILNENVFDESSKDYRLGKYKNEKLDANYFKNLRDELFEGIKREKNSNEKKNLSIYKRDIFYEAVIDIEKTLKENNNNNKINILGDDYITPHKSPLKNPNPIKFIKLMPNIVIRFQFDLKDGLLTSEEKKSLFDHIIQDFGIGAKTNVGYGILEKIDN